MTYICEGSIRTATDDSDSDSDTDEYPIYEFDVLGQNSELVLTLCFGSFEEFKRLV